MRNPLAVGIWLLRIAAAFLAAVWLYQDVAQGAQSTLHSVERSIDGIPAGLFFLLGGVLLVALGMNGRRSNAD